MSPANSCDRLAVMSTATTASSPNPNKRKRTASSEVDRLWDVIGGGEILHPSEVRREGAVDRSAVTGVNKTSRPRAKRARSNEVQPVIACRCCTIAYTKSCRAPKHIIKQITSSGSGLGSSLPMLYETEESIAQKLRPFFDTSFDQLQKIVIRRQVYQPIDMSLAMAQIRINSQIGDHTFDVRDSYNKRGCVIRAGLKILREAQRLSLGYNAFSIVEDSTQEVELPLVGLCVQRTIEVRISKKGGTPETSKEHNEVYKELEAIAWDAREQEIQGWDELYTWLRSKNADMIVWASRRH